MRKEANYLHPPTLREAFSVIKQLYQHLNLCTSIRRGAAPQKAELKTDGWEPAAEKRTALCTKCVFTENPLTQKQLQCFKFNQHFVEAIHTVWLPTHNWHFAVCSIYFLVSVPLKHF